MSNGTSRGVWSSKIGFVLAAAGSAIGLGNIWKFPYICGEHGGGAFVAIYLLCILIVGLPIMIGEIMLGRMTQKSPVSAIAEVAGDKSPWRGVGGMGVCAAFFMLSYYSIVAGWACRYTFMALTGDITSGTPDEIKGKFGEVATSNGHQLFWHVLFMGITMLVVVGGIQRGIERWARILMPTLFVMLLVLLYQATQQSGWSDGVSFVFSWNTENLSAEGVLEALGHSFFTLSLGMGAMITYGSYLRRESSLVANSIAISVLDTVIALMACLILFPITFSYGMGKAAGPGLVFENIPVALSQMPGGQFLSILFFALLVFAALTSAISLLEVVSSYFIDRKGWSRKRAAIACAIAITAFGVPSALSNGTEMFGAGFAAAKEDVLGQEWGDITKGNWFDFLDYVVSNWMLPLGGLLIAVFLAWRVGDKARKDEFIRNTTLGHLYASWVVLLKWIVPAIVIVVCLYSTKVLHVFGLFSKD